MNPTIWGVIGPGFLNQVPTLAAFGFRVQGRPWVSFMLSQLAHAKRGRTVRIRPTGTHVRQNKKAKEWINRFRVFRVVPAIELWDGSLDELTRGFEDRHQAGKHRS